MSVSGISGPYTVAYAGDTTTSYNDPTKTLAALAAQLQADPNGRTQYATQKAAEIAAIAQGPDAGTPAGYQQLAKLREEMRYMQEHVGIEDIAFQQSMRTQIADAGKVQRDNLAVRLAADPAAAQQYVLDKQAEIAALEAQSAADPEGTNRHLDDLRDEMAHLQRQAGMAPDVLQGLEAQQAQAAGAQHRIMEAHLKSDVAAQNKFLDRMNKEIGFAKEGSAVSPADSYADLNRMYNQMSSLTATADPALLAQLQQLMTVAKTEADRIHLENPGALGDNQAFIWGV